VRLHPLHRLLRTIGIVSTVAVLAASSFGLHAHSQSTPPDEADVVVKVRGAYLTAGKGGSMLVAAADREARVRQLCAVVGVSRVKSLWASAAQSQSQGATPIENPGLSTFVVEPPPTLAPQVLVDSLSRQPWVEYAEIDRKFSLHSTPNDPLFSRQWDLANTGQLYWSFKQVVGDSNDTLIEVPAQAGADIRYLSFYEDSSQETDVLVAIVDTGLDTTHVELHDRLSPNPGEIPGNGIDDDHDGFVDDVYGWDFSGDKEKTPIQIVGDNDITDAIGHGTHVAGTVAASVNNGIGIAGVAPHARIIGSKIFPNAFFSVSAQGIYYAVLRGARVINMSWGGGFRSRALEDALDYAHDLGVVLVCSMGNSGRGEYLYPAAYSVTIGVGATDSHDRVSDYSTYNDQIDVVAPGTDILSLHAAGTDLYADIGEPNVHIVDSLYLIATGTSMSSPHVAGAAAALLSVAPGLSNDRVRDILRESADDLLDPYQEGDSLLGWDVYSGAGRINLQRALTLLPSVAVSVVAPRTFSWVPGGQVPILGFVGGKGFHGYTVQIASGHPPNLGEWQTIANSDSLPGGSQLALWDSGNRQGPYTLRVDAGTDAVATVPFFLVTAPAVQIDKPVPSDTIRLFRPILGSAAAAGFQSYELDAIGPLPSPESRQIAWSSRPVWDDTLAFWHTDSLAAGDYDVVLTVNTESGAHADTVRVAVADPFLAGWPVDLPSPSHFAVTTVNLDGVGGDEIICPTSQGVYVLRTDGSIYPGWPRGQDNGLSTAPAVADLDGDGRSEIIVASDSRMFVYAFIGEDFPGWPQTFLGSTQLFGHSLPVVGDIDTVSGLEIAAADRHGRIQVWHHDGTLFSPKGGLYYARIATTNTASAALVSLSVCDLDGDGRKEMIVAGDGVHVFDALTAEPYKGNDSSLVAPAFATRGMVVGDLNGDGVYDIAYLASQSNTAPFYLNVIDAHGQSLPGWPRTVSQFANLSLLYSLSAGDVDGDGLPELFFAPAFTDGYLYAFHGNGEPLSQGSADGLLAVLPGTVSPITLVNIDGDEAPEILMRVGYPYSGPDLVYAINADGSPVPGFPIAFGEGFSTDVPAPLIGDIDHNGSADMTTVQSTSRNVAVWDLGLPASVVGRSWPKFRGDLWNSGIAPTPRYDILYLVRLLDYAFGRAPQLPPYEPTDLNCDGHTDASDVTRLVDYLYHNGARPCLP